MAKQLTDLPVQTSAVDDGLLLFQDPARSAGDQSTQIEYSTLVEPLLQKANNLADLNDPEAARTNLGLGDLATADGGDFVPTAAVGATNGIAPLASGKVPQANLPSAYTNTQSVTPLAVAYAASVTINLNLRNNFVIGDLTGNIILTFTNPVAGASGSITLRQDSVGGRTLTIAGSNVLIAGGSATLSTAPGVKDKLYWDSDDGSIVNLVLQKFS